MATGAAFYVGRIEEQNSNPLNYRTNVTFSTNDGSALYIVDCHNTQNQVAFSYGKGPTFDYLRGPDLLDGALLKAVSDICEDEKFTKYFLVRTTSLSGSN